MCKSSHSSLDAAAERGAVWCSAMRCGAALPCCSHGWPDLFSVASVTVRARRMQPVHQRLPRTPTSRATTRRSKSRRRTQPNPPPPRRRAAAALRRHCPPAPPPPPPPPPRLPRRPPRRCCHPRSTPPSPAARCCTACTQTGPRRPWSTSRCSITCPWPSCLAACFPTRRRTDAFGSVDAQTTTPHQPRPNRRRQRRRRRRRRMRSTSGCQCARTNNSSTISRRNIHPSSASICLLMDETHASFAP